MTKIVLTFHGTSTPQSDGRFTMADDSQGSMQQTFIVELGEEIRLADPSQFQELTVVIDEVL